MKKILFTLLTLSSFLSNAQQPEWVRSIGGANNELSVAITVDASGNVYTTGHFEGTVDFDPGPANYTLVSAGSWDIFIAKHDMNGNLLWAKRMGGSSIDGESGTSVTVDNTGNVYFTGAFTNAGDFGGINLTSFGWRDAFICKLDNNGNVLWAKNIGSVDVDGASAIKQDAAGNLYVIGVFQGTVDFDPGPGVYNLTEAGNSDAFILKLDSNGNFIWAKSIGGDMEDSGNSLALDQSGALYIAGCFKDTADFDPGPAVYNLYVPSFSAYYGMYILKLDANGNFAWAKTPAGTQDVFCNSIALDNQANVYTYGYFEGTIDADPGPGIYNYTSLGFAGYDSFILKLDSAGNFSWSRRVEGSGSEYAISIALDASDNIYFAGDFDDTLYIDPGFNLDTLFANYSSDGFVSVLNNTGSFLGYAQVKGKGFGWAHVSSVVADAGYFYVTGNFNDTVSFNSQLADTIASNGDFDMFVAKYALDPVGMEKKDVQDICSAFPNPSPGKLMIRYGKSAGTLAIQISNSSGEVMRNETIQSVPVFSVELPDLPGLYFVTITDDKGLKTVVKVLKQ